MAETGAGRDQVINATWATIRGKLRSEFGQSKYNSWLKPLLLIDCVDGTVELAVPTEFMGNWVDKQYGTRLNQLWVENHPEARKVKIVVKPEGQPVATRPPGRQARQAGEQQDAPTAPEKFSGSPLAPGFTFKKFVVGIPNQLAYAAAQRVASLTDYVSDYNPLFIHGNAGVGKTHLMNAIAWQIRADKQDREVVYLSAERFIQNYVSAVQSRQMEGFKDRYRSIDLLMIDDFHLICGKAGTQQELIHTLDELMNKSRQIVIADEATPASLVDIEDRLRSRLSSGLVVGIGAMTHELRLRILYGMVEEQNVKIPETVLEFLAERIVSDIRTMKGALTRLVAQAENFSIEITVELCQEILSDLIRAVDRRITVDEIQKRVAEHYGISVSEMQAKNRSREIVRPRHIAMYLARQLTTRSMPEIGRQFGKRDHTTVLHAVRKIQEVRDSDPAVAEEIEALCRGLERH